MAIFPDSTQVVDDHTKSLIHHLFGQMFPEGSLFEFSAMLFDKFFDHPDGIEFRLMDDLPFLICAASYLPHIVI